jgi:hypothetical protein
MTGPAVTKSSHAVNHGHGVPIIGLGVAKGHFLAKSAVSFSSYGKMGRNGTRYARFSVEKRGTGPLYGAFLPFYERLWSCMEIS